MAHHTSPPGTDPVLPTRIPLFPLRGALLLPGGELPLNIFEPRYRAMTEWALRTDRLIGMIQPRAGMPQAGMPRVDTARAAQLLPDTTQLHPVGCLGRITQYQETDDGRYLITLRGIKRFRLCDTPQLTEDQYLLAGIDCSDFAADAEPQPEPPAHLCRREIKDVLNRFLAGQNLCIDWDQAGRVSDAKFYTLLAMVAPLCAADKQALLEADSAQVRYALLVQMLEIALAEQERTDNPAHFH